MAGQQGAAFYTPLLWPLPHLAKALSSPVHDVPGPMVSAPLGVLGHLSAVMSCTRNLFLAWICVFWLDSPYPALGRASSWSWSWVWPILLRNLLGTWIICGGWDWLLYFSPLSPKLHKYKMTPAYPPLSQFVHDSFFTTLASLITTLLEVVLCHLYSTGYLSFTPLSEAPLLHFLLAVTTTHWRMPHFHLIHRLIHPWRLPPPLPDPGRHF